MRTLRNWPLVALLGLLIPAGEARAQSNIDGTGPNQHAWGENIGWTNWRDADGAAQGVFIGPFVMSGFIWAENIGWIDVGDGAPVVAPYYGNTEGGDFGVNIASDGSLSGFGWSENAGWINFGGGATATPPLPARIECADPPAAPLARLTGFAWGENIGWLNLSEVVLTQHVALDAAFSPLSCDMNDDGLANGLDIQNFVTHLLAASGTWRETCSGDIESPPDGQLDLDDVAPFVSCLLNQP